MSDILSEKLVSLSAAAASLPVYRSGRPTNPSTIWRWIRDGVQIPSGERIRLEATKIGARWLTSEQALTRFSAAITAAHTAATPLPSPRAPAKCAAAAKRAGRRLELAGA